MRNYRITEWLELGGTLKILFQTLCHGHGHSAFTTTLSPITPLHSLPNCELYVSKLLHLKSSMICQNKSYKASYVSIFMQARMEETRDVWKFLKQPFSWLLCQNIKFYSGVTGRGWLLKVFPLECFKFLLFKRHDAPDLEGCYSSLFMLLSIWHNSSLVSRTSQSREITSN